METSSKALTRSERRARAVRQWYDAAELASSEPSFDASVVEDICIYLVNHDTSLAAICRDKLVPGAPSLSTLMFWRRVDKRVGAALSAAQEARAEMRWAEFSEMIEPVLEEAAATGSSQMLSAAKARLDFELKVRMFEVKKRVASIYGDGAVVAKEEPEKQAAPVVVVPAKGSVDGAP